MSLVSTRDINGGQPFSVADITGRQPTQAMISPATAQQLYKPSGDINKPLRFFVQVNPASAGYEYFVEGDPITLTVPAMPGNPPRILNPVGQPIFRGREGTAGQQIRGGEKAKSPVAVYSFTDAAPGATSG